MVADRVYVLDEVADDSAGFCFVVPTASLLARIVEAIAVVLPAGDVEGRESRNRVARGGTASSKAPEWRDEHGHDAGIGRRHARDTVVERERAPEVAVGADGRLFAAEDAYVHALRNLIFLVARRR